MSFRFKCAACAVLWVLLVGLASASAIVTFRTPERVVLAVDAAFTQFDERGDVTGTSTGCKLDRAGDWYVGWGGSRNVAGVDLQDPIGTIITPAHTLPALVAAMRGYMTTDLAALKWREMRGAFPVGKVVLWLGAGRMNGSTPELAIFRAIIRSHEPATFDVTAVSCPGNCRGVMTAGQAYEPGPIATHLSGVLPPWVTPLDGRVAHRLIAETAATSPTFVRPPIDTLEIDANGARWIHRDPNSACPINPLTL